MNKVSKLLLIIVVSIFIRVETSDTRVYYLEPEETLDYNPATNIDVLQIFCYKGTDKSLSTIFRTVQLELNVNEDDFTQYEGADPESVKEDYENKKSIFSFNILSFKRTKLKLNPFNQTCIGIESAHPFKVKLNLVRIDFWNVILFIVGFVVFWSSGKLSTNSFFYYVSGILLGIFASLLILIYFIGKLFPSRPLMYGVLLGGWTVALYLVQKLIENFQAIFVIHKVLIFWYIVITGMISFIICYRLGPPENQRSKDLIKWGLQLIALIMMFFSSHYEEASSAAVLITVLAYYTPRSWIGRAQKSYYRWFPPKTRLLTNEEYYEQGVQETSKALTELRKYCNSPECKQWKVVTKLKDPLRFANFIEGSSHLSDEEILEYDTSRFGNSSDSEISEDEDIECSNTNAQNNINIRNQKSFMSSQSPISDHGGRNRSQIRYYSEDANDDLSEDDDNDERNQGAGPSSNGQRLSHYLLNQRSRETTTFPRVQNSGVSPYTNRS